MHHWFSGRNFPRVRERLALSELLNCNLDWLMKGDGPIEKNLQANDDQGLPHGAVKVREVPVVSWSHAGEAATYEELPKHWQGHVATTSRDRRAFGLIVEGDCMEPKYQPGDILVIQPTEELRNGKAVVAKLDNDAVQVRIYHKMPNGKIRLASLKPEIYPTIEYSRKDFSWIWPVHSMTRNE